LFIIGKEKRKTLEEMDAAATNRFEKIASCFFGVMTLSSIVFYIGVGSSIPVLVYISKPIPVILWMIFVTLYSRAGYGTTYESRLVFGLFFSLLGDVFLMLPDPHGVFFVLGLVSFLVTHMFYTFAFIHLDKDFHSLSSWGVLCGCLYVSGAICVALFPKTGSLAVPVIIYIIIESVMVWRAITASLQENERHILLAAVGAVCFLASDSFLAVNKFSVSGGFPYAQMFTLSLYWIAQCSIALSVWRKSPNNEEKSPVLAHQTQSSE
jgi:uncharacterized membrane protein YhhN